MWPCLYDEFDSACYFALVEAAESFDLLGATPFATFARYRIRGALLDVQRLVVPLGYRTDPKHAPKMEGLSGLPENDGRVICVEDDETVGFDLESDEEFEAMMRRLPAKHAQICRLIYKQGLSQYQAAEVIGLSQSRLSYIHKESMAILNGSWEREVLAC